MRGSIKPQNYQGTPRGQSRNRHTAINLGTYALVGIEIKLEAEGIAIGTIIDPIIEIGQETTIGVTVEETTTGQMMGMTITDQMIGETVTDKMIGETIIDKAIERTIIEIDQLWKGYSTEI